MSTIVIAPFSNSEIRDWPSEHFGTLVGLLLDQWDGAIRVIGTRGQWSRACEIVRAYDPLRVANDCGKMAWPQVEDSLRSAACVIGNNSGIAHLAGSFDVPVVCIFGGSHQRAEWRPLGPNVALITRSVGCSPCHLDHGRLCSYNKACLDEIAPGDVARVTFEIMARRREADAACFSTTDERVIGG